MSIRRSWASLVFVLPLLSFACSRGPDSPPPSPPVSSPPGQADISAELESRLPALLDEANIAGLSICLIQSLEIAWCGAFGSADSESGRPVDTNTIFQAASLSKPVFAYTVLRLVDRGVIDLDTPLVNYVDEKTIKEIHLGEDFDDVRVGKITARMALTHTSGLPNWRRNGRLEFLFDPGSQFGYSGEGIGLLQKVVEQITGEPLEELVAEQTFEPLGMTNSTYTASKIDLERYAWPHDGAGTISPRPPELLKRIERARPHAAATLNTTAADYAKFVIALMAGAGLEESTARQMVRPQVDIEDQSEVAWGLGVGLEKAEGSPHPWHWGDNDDSKAFFIADPEDGSGLVYFSNSYNGLSIVGGILEIACPGDHPLLDGALLSSYPAHDSPEFRFSTAVYSGGAAEAVAVVRDLQTKGVASPVAEPVVNRMGYWLMGRDRLEEAYTLFELNVELYPEAWNVYDSLGEAQLKMGQREDAIASYRRSLELNPENHNGRRALEEMSHTTR